MANGELSLDALIPQEMASKAETIGVRKARMKFFNTMALAVLAGSFIAIGGMFSTTLTAEAGGVLPYGVVRLLAGVSFSLGLILVVVGGAELFTGNNLIVMAWAGGKVTSLQLLRNWVIVYFGNLIGALATAAIVFTAHQYLSGGGAVGLAMLGTAVGKLNHSFISAVASGMMANALVCMAVWMTYSARTVSDKILAIVLPITAFVAAGFEHSIANMYFLPIAWMVKTFDPAFTTKILAETPLAVENLTWANIVIKNLIPVTMGNILGGAGMVGLVYWAVYLRKNHAAAAATKIELAAQPVKQEVETNERR